MKAIDKIKKLLSLSMSSNENEAAAALSKAMSICAENNLDIKEISPEDNDKIIKKTECGKVKSKLEKWEKLLMEGLGDLLGCCVLYSTKHTWKGTRKSFSLVGTEKDIEIANHMFLYLSREINKIANRSYRRELYITSSEHIYKNSFKRGAVHRITERAKEFFNQNASEQEKQEYALVLKRGAKAKKYVDNMGLSIARNSSSKTDSQALYNGYRAADNISLNHAIKGGKMTTGALNG